MTGKTKEAAKAARMVSPSKRSPIRSKKRANSRERKKRVSKSGDNTTKNSNSTKNHIKVDTDGNERTLEVKPENRDELYTLLGKVNGKDLEGASLNNLREIALEWKDYHEDETDILSMTKKELECQLIEWSMEIKNRMDIDEVPPLQESPNEGLDLSHIKNMQQLETFSELELIKYLHHNRAGTQIGDMSKLPDKDIEYLRIQTMRSIQYDRAKDIKATMKDTLFYLETSDYYEDLHKDLFVLKHHATNWKRYKNEPVEDIQNENIKDVLCNMLEDARSELEQKKPPPFKIDLQTQIEMNPEFECESEEHRHQVASLIRQIITEQAEDLLTNKSIDSTKNLMLAWAKANLLDPTKIKKMNEDELREYYTETLQKVWDERDEANPDEAEELRTLIDSIKDEEDINEKLFAKISKKQLELYIYHKRAEHKDYVDENTISKATREDLIQQIINNSNLEKYVPTISETKYFLGNEEMTQNIEGITIQEKIQHLKNWNSFCGINTSTEEFDDEFIELAFREAIDNWSNHPDKPKFDKKVKKMSDIIDSEEDQCRTSDQLPKLEAKMTNKEINSLTEAEAQMVYKQYIVDKGFEEEQKDLHKKTNEWVLTRITFIRDALYKRANELDTIFESEDQESIQLLQDTMDITAELTDREIDNMDSETLAKVYYKRNKIENIATKISGYFLWSDSTLRRAIKTIRNEDKEKNKKTLVSSLKIGKHQGRKTIQTSLPGKAMNTWRYSMSFKIGPEYKGTDGLKRYLQYVFQEMQSYDEGVKILQWNDDSTQNGLDHISKFPKTITSLKKYFDNARPQNNGGQVYVKVRIGLPITSDRETFETDFRGWAKGEDLRLYECTVQHHNTRSVGWLVYAPNSLNGKKWSKAVMKMYAQTAHNTPGATITVGVAWKALNGQYEIAQKDKLYAMHVECPFDQVTQVKRFLRFLSRNKSYPLGVKFRLMADFTVHMKENNKEKHRYMVNKHRAFLSQIKRVTCTQVLSLDKKIKNTDTSIRQIVTDIRDNADEKKIFGSIDEHWSNPCGCTATYRPDKDSKAISFMKSLSTYVKHKFPKANLSGTFTLEAIAKAQAETFSENNQEFKTEEDDALLHEVESDLDDDSLDFLTIDPDDLLRVRKEIEAKIPETIIGGEKLIDLQGENETLSTASNLTSVSFTNRPSCFVFDDQKSASSINSETINSSSTEKEISTNVSSITPISQLEEQFRKSNANLNNTVNASQSTDKNVECDASEE